VPDYASVLLKVVAIFGVINRVPATTPAHNVFCYSAVAHILTSSVNLAFRPKSGFKNKCRAPTVFGLGSNLKELEKKNNPKFLIFIVFLHSNWFRCWKIPNHMFKKYALYILHPVPLQKIQRCFFFKKQKNYFFKTLFLSTLVLMCHVRVETGKCALPIKMTHKMQ